MYLATRSLPLATTITGSLPRPLWFTENLRGRPFLNAVSGDLVYREQYADAVAALIADQTRAGLDIVSDGEMRFDMDVGGRSWFGYLFDRMEGLGHSDVRKGGSEWVARSGTQRRTDTPGDILHEVMQTRLPPPSPRAGRTGHAPIRCRVEDRATAHGKTREDGQLLGTDDRQNGGEQVLQEPPRIRYGTLGRAPCGAPSSR
jgi:hypothetical protein